MFSRLSTPTFSTVFFFNDTATTEIYTLSLHDALPISARSRAFLPASLASTMAAFVATSPWARSEEHTSELQSHSDLVCRLLLEKKKGEKTDDEMFGRVASALDIQCLALNIVLDDRLRC